MEEFHDNFRRWEVEYDGLSKFFTLVICFLCLAVPVAFVLHHETSWLFWLVTGLLVFSLVVAWSLAPRYIETSNKGIRIVRNIGTLFFPMDNLQEVRSQDLTPTDIRLFGTNGLFGYLGVWRNQRDGRYFSFRCKREGLLLLSFKMKRYNKIMLSCKDSEGLKDYLKKYIPVVISLFATVLSANARSGMYPNGDEYFPVENAVYEPLVMEISSTREIEDLKAQGVIVLRQRGDLLLTFVPQKQAQQIKGKESRKIKVKQYNRPALDYSLKFGNAISVLDGSGNEALAYDGKNVVVGICDSGFDPTHPAFLNESQTDTRIKRITQYVEDRGLRLQMDSPAEFQSWGTDNPDGTHGTHVAGILAGGYNAEGYRGIASGADIVVSTCQLSDVGLLAGAEDILDVAKAEGKPCVINLSMGNYIGPHDGSSLFCRYLDMMADEAIIVLSAGNEGSRTNTVKMTFDNQNGPMRFRLASYRWTQFDMYGYTDLWNSTEKPFIIQPVVYDEYHNKIVYPLPEVKLNDGEIWGVASSDPVEYETLDEEFAKYYDGWINIQAQKWDGNDRMNVLVTYDAHTTAQSPAGPWAIYNLAFIVKGEQGEEIDAYADGQLTFLKTWPGSGCAPSSAMSISDLACGHKTISVGMHITRNVVPTLSGVDFQYPDPTGQVSKYSSYATLNDGRVMPLTVAPGGLIISSASRPWAESNQNYLSECAASGSLHSGPFADTPIYYYTRDVGTSMSAPYVAGFIAAWLQANPELKWNDVQKIIKQSNSQPLGDAADPRNGQGWFDPVKGLQLVLDDIGTKVGDPSESDFSIKPISSGWEIYGEGVIEYKVLNIAGEVVHMGKGLNNIIVSLDSFPAGVYLIRVNNQGFSKTIKSIGA